MNATNDENTFKMKKKKKIGSRNTKNYMEIKFVLIMLNYPDGDIYMKKQFDWTSNLKVSNK